MSRTRPPPLRPRTVLNSTKDPESPERIRRGGGGEEGGGGWTQTRRSKATSALKRLSLAERVAVRRAPSTLSLAHSLAHFDLDSSHDRSSQSPGPSPDLPETSRVSEGLPRCQVAVLHTGVGRGGTTPPVDRRFLPSSWVSEESTY